MDGGAPTTGGPSPTIRWASCEALKACSWRSPWCEPSGVALRGGVWQGFPPWEGYICDAVGYPGWSSQCDGGQERIMREISIQSQRGDVRIQIPDCRPSTGTISVKARGIAWGEAVLLMEQAKSQIVNVELQTGIRRENSFSLNSGISLHAPGISWGEAVVAIEQGKFLVIHTEIHRGLSRKNRELVFSEPGYQCPGGEQ